jgi:hypothetical protein
VGPRMLCRNYIITLLLLSGAVSLSAQSLPMIAKTRQTDEVMVNGKVVQMHVMEGVFYRSSTGSELRRWTKRDGKEAVGHLGWGALHDTQNNVDYSIDYNRKIAYVIAPALPTDTGAQRPRALGDDSVEGIACTLQPILLAIPGRSPRRIGQDCYSKDYDVELKSDIKYAADSSGKTLHSRFELYDIQVGVAPDPKLFDLTRFTISRD